MLSRKEKKEMLKDGYSKSRRKGFVATKKPFSNASDSFDEYIEFLTSVQKIFPRQSLRRKTIIKFNKL